jgi:Flp pilus assembly pilin Flp
MTIKKFLQKDDGMVATEYVIFVAAIGILMAVGVGVLFNAMSVFFSSWAGYFGGGG